MMLPTGLLRIPDEDNIGLEKVFRYLPNGPESVQVFQKSRKAFRQFSCQNNQRMNRDENEKFELSRRNPALRYTRHHRRHLR